MTVANQMAMPNSQAGGEAIVEYRTSGVVRGEKELWCSRYKPRPLKGGGQTLALLCGGQRRDYCFHSPQGRTEDRGSSLPCYLWVFPDTSLRSLCSSSCGFTYFCLQRGIWPFIPCVSLFPGYHTKLIHLDASRKSCWLWRLNFPYKTEPNNCHSVRNVQLSGGRNVINKFHQLWTLQATVLAGQVGCAGWYHSSMTALGVANGFLTGFDVQRKNWCLAL